MQKFHNVVKYLLLAGFVVLAAVLILEASLPGDESKEHSDVVGDIITDILDLPEEDLTFMAKFNLFVRKSIGHFGAFFVLGILFMSSHLMIFQNKKLIYIVAPIFGLVFSSVTELIQLFVPNRFGTIEDVLIDYSGYLVGIGIITFIYILIKRKKKKQD